MQYNYASRMDGLKASAIREILKHTADPSVISFAAGNPAPEAFPIEDITRITAEIMHDNPIGALQYSLSEGYPALRSAVKAQLKERHSIGRDFDDVIITSGAQEGIQLACKVLCDKGDTLICENPSFIGSLNAFKTYEVNLVGVDMDSDGINIEKLEKAIAENKSIKAIYLIPNFQNPSGITMSLEKRRAVYEICVKNDIVIIEDNPYGELRFDGENIPNIKAMDDEGIVIYCGTFSKVLSPGLRVGYLCANAELLQKITVLKQVNDVHTSILSQMICERFLAEVDFSKHIERLREIYRVKASLMYDEIKKNLNPKITVNKVQGGLFMWAQLPDGTDMEEFCKTAVMNKVAVVPGSAFMPSANDKTNSFRLNYSTPTNEQMIKGLEILGRLSYDIIK